MGYTIRTKMSFLKWEGGEIGNQNAQHCAINIVAQLLQKQEGGNQNQRAG